MEWLKSVNTFKDKLKFHFDFLKHTRNPQNSTHIVTNEDKRLREIIIQNYYKSLMISNILALYLNYIRKNKSFFKSLFSNIIYV
jgi:hypothetical protein